MVGFKMKLYLKNIGANFVRLTLALSQLDLNVKLGSCSTKKQIKTNQNKTKLVLALSKGDGT